MKKFAQIVEKKAHWIFEAEEVPVFAPYIVLIEITGNDQVKEGWNYDTETGIFSKPQIVNFETEPTIEEYILDIDFRICNLELGL